MEDMTNMSAWLSLVGISQLQANVLYFHFIVSAGA